MRSELRRLRIIAQRRGLCPTHLAKLTCGCTRQWRWTGTEGEWEEYTQLMVRAEPLYLPLFVHGDCSTCGSDRFCETCVKAHMVRGPNPFTEPEMERMHVLAALMVRQAPDHAV